MLLRKYNNFFLINEQRFRQSAISVQQIFVKDILPNIDKIEIFNTIIDGC